MTMMTVQSLVVAELKQEQETVSMVLVALVTKLRLEFVLQILALVCSHIKKFWKCSSWFLNLFQCGASGLYLVTAQLLVKREQKKGQELVKMGLVAPALLLIVHLVT